MWWMFVLGCGKAGPGAVEPVVAERSLGFAPLRAMLMARHPEDLPDRTAIDAQGGAEGLSWLATHDELLLVQERALVLLGLYGSHPICLEGLETGHPKRIAAAILCLSPDEVDARLRERLTDLAASPDPRVADAAAKLLARAGVVAPEER